jgi:hypothetical protein
MALFVPGVAADSYTYTYTGQDFDSNLSNLVGDLYQFLPTDSVTATITLAAPIPWGAPTEIDYVNNTPDPDPYSADLLSWSMSAGGLTLSSSDPNATLGQLVFDGDPFTIWDMVAYGLPASAPPDLDVSYIVTMGNPDSSIDYGDLISNDSSFRSNEGISYEDPGSWALTSSETSSVPEPATVTMLIAGLAFLGKKRLSGRRGKAGTAGTW